MSYSEDGGCSLVRIVNKFSWIILKNISVENANKRHLNKILSSSLRKSMYYLCNIVTAKMADISLWTTEQYLKLPIYVNKKKSKWF